MKGWFDAFRYDGGPTLYNFNNRTAVTGDVTLITFLTIFCTLYVAFLIIFPGIRKERLTTFFTVSLSLFVGGTIFISLFGSSWHVGKSSIISSYRAFTKEKIVADLGVYIGLNHVNVTLQAPVSINWTADIDFNERFYWLNSNEMGDNFRKALHRGLPFPILTVAEYFIGQEGLSWGSQYRAAGYFAIIMLMFSFVTWVLMNLMLMVVPRYGALLMSACGILLLATVCGYLGMLPEKPLVIHVEGYTVHFSLGWSFWLVFISGCTCLLSGVIITTVEIFFPHSFSTILEVDYDTPYDRHIIIEDSHGKRYQKKRLSNNSKLEEPTGIGIRILRRLSSKTRENNRNEDGLENRMFEMEIPKSQWRYPVHHSTMLSKKSNLSRHTSSDSIASNRSKNIAPIHKEIPRVRSPPDKKLNEIPMW